MAKNLGKVTAYAHAKAGGYTGTQDEFNAMLAGLDEYNEAAAQSAEEASGYAEEASGYADNASESASDAAGSVEQAASIVAEAISYTVRRFEKKFTVSSSTSSFTFDPTGYTYSNDDRFEVYVNGSKLVDDGYTNSSNVITLTTAVSSGTVEIIGFKNVDLTTDTTLSLTGVAADAKKTGDEIDALKDDLEHIEGISEPVKVALLDIVSHIALWTDGDGQQYYDALEEALYSESIPMPDLHTGNLLQGYIYNNEGEIVETENAYVNEKYFPIQADGLYRWVQGFNGYVSKSNNVLYGNMNAYRVCYYDENKTFIERQVSAYSNEFGIVESRYLELTPPQNAAYIRVSWNGINPSLSGQFYKNIPDDLYAVTIVLAYLNDSTINNDSDILNRVSIMRDGRDVTEAVGFAKYNASGNIPFGRPGWCRNIFDVVQGGSPETGNQNPGIQTRIYNSSSILLQQGDVIKFNDVKAAVRAERISDGYVQHPTAWITDNSDFVIGGE